jgi:hypothetical protein
VDILYVFNALACTLLILFGVIIRLVVVRQITVVFNHHFEDVVTLN